MSSQAMTKTAAQNATGATRSALRMSEAHRDQIRKLTDQVSAMTCVLQCERALHAATQAQHRDMSASHDFWRDRCISELHRQANAAVAAAKITESPF